MVHYCYFRIKIQYMDIIKQLNWRYATKKFDRSKKVSDAKLDVIKQAYNLTALSYGLQTSKLVIVSDDSIKAKFVELCYGQQQVAQASHILVICIQKTVGETDVDAHFDNIKSIRNTPEMVLAKFRKEQKEYIASRTQEQIDLWCKNQAYIILGNLMTVCAVEEIDACPMEGFIPSKVDDLLGLDALNLKSVLLLPIGYRAEDDMFAGFKKVRKSLSETIIEI